MKKYITILKDRNYCLILVLVFVSIDSYVCTKSIIHIGGTSEDILELTYSYFCIPSHSQQRAWEFKQGT